MLFLPPSAALACFAGTAVPLWLFAALFVLRARPGKDAGGKELPGDPWAVLGGAVVGAFALLVTAYCAAGVYLFATAE